MQAYRGTPSLTFLPMANKPLAVVILYAPAWHFDFVNYDALAHVYESPRVSAVAGLFALHPLHVESVAWVSERKGADERASERFVGKPVQPLLLLSRLGGFNKLADRVMYLLQMMQSWFGRFSKLTRDSQVEIGQLIGCELVYCKHVITTVILQCKILSHRSGSVKLRFP